MIRWSRCKTRRPSSHRPWRSSSTALTRSVGVTARAATYTKLLVVCAMNPVAWLDTSRWSHWVRWCVWRQRTGIVGSFCPATSVHRLQAGLVFVSDVHVRHIRTSQILITERLTWVITPTVATSNGRWRIHGGRVRWKRVQIQTDAETIESTIRYYD